MNTKKISTKDLENKKSLFFKTGLALSLAFVLLAFQYQVTERVITDLPDMPVVVVEDEIIEITIPEKPEPPPPLDSQDFTLVPDDIDIDDAAFQIDVDATAEVPELSFDPVVFSREEKPGDDEIFVRPEVLPEFPGGMEAMYAYFGKTINYPRLARELHIQGTVYIGFVVEADGSISNVHLIRGIEAGCDEEAIQAVENMPNWIPGRMGTQAVRVRFSVPVHFRLN